MSLSDFQVPTESVKIPGGASFSVRGLSLDDISSLVQRYRPALQSIYEEFEQQGDFTLESTASLVEGMIASFPGFVAYAIALASDEPEQAELARKLPMSVQVEAVEHIGRLTFVAEGGPKKVLATVVRVLKGARESVGSLGTSSSQGATSLKA